MLVTTVLALSLCLPTLAQNGGPGSGDHVQCVPVITRVNITIKIVPGVYLTFPIVTVTQHCS